MIIFELDGVLADIEHRRHFVDPTCSECKQRLTDEIKFDLGWHCHYPCDNVTMDWQPDWQAFYEACDKDKPIEYVRYIMEALYYGHEANMCIWSSRCESSRDKTEKWLKMNIPRDWYIDLKMHSIGDDRPAHVIKEEWLLDSALETKWGNKIKVDMVFESDPESIAMYRRHGIFVFDCCQHNNEF